MRLALDVEFFGGLLDGQEASLAVFSGHANILCGQHPAGARFAAGPGPPDAISWACWPQGLPAHALLKELVGPLAPRVLRAFAGLGPLATAALGGVPWS
jgi:hypothetical protein